MVKQHVEVSTATVLPPVFVCTIIGTIWSIYTFLHLLPSLRQHNFSEVPRPAFETLVSQLLSAMILICYVLSAITSPGLVPEAWEWQLGSDKALPLMREVKSSTGERRRCKRCMTYKPDRCHHCRVCKACILRMDHHCPWIMNCIGFGNHKYFLLLVFYSVLGCGFMGSTVLESVIRSVTEDRSSMHRFLLVLCFVLSLIMFVLLSVFLAFHVWLVQKALTTIEFCEKSKCSGSVSAGSGGAGGSEGRSPYHVGPWDNIVAVLGPRPVFWLLPVYLPAGDSVIFDPRPDPEWTGRAA